MASTTDRRTRKKLDTRSRIQATALRLFSEHGYRETTLSSIAEAADVAMRTVTLHFATKEDLVFADLIEDRFAPETLAPRIAQRPPGESTLQAVRAWMVDTMAEVTNNDPATEERVWHQRTLRSRLIMANDELRGRARADYFPYERIIAAGVGDDLGQPADALVPRLAAVAVTAGLRELLEVSQVDINRPPSSDHLLDLIDQVLDFAGAGAATVLP